MTARGSTVTGVLRRVDGRTDVELESVYDTDPSDLWAAVTEPARLARWLGEVDGDLRAGGSFRADLDGDVATGEILVCEPPARLQLTWCFGDDPPTLIAVELTPVGARTRLALHERGVPEDDAAGFGAGWQAYLEVLGDVLAGSPARDRHARFRELVPAYRAQRPATA
jgi:uncharacterized protein YndB with AHSA1/START domain